MSPHAIINNMDTHRFFHFGAVVGCNLLLHINTITPGVLIVILANLTLPMPGVYPVVYSQVTLIGAVCHVTVAIWAGHAVAPIMSSLSRSIFDGFLRLYNIMLSLLSCVPLKMLYSLNSGSKCLSLHSGISVRAANSGRVSLSSPIASIIDFTQPTRCIFACVSWMSIDLS